MTMPFEPTMPTCIVIGKSFFVATKASAEFLSKDRMMVTLDKAGTLQR